MKLNPLQHNIDWGPPHKKPRRVYALQTEAGIKRPRLFTYKPLCSLLDSHHFLIQLQMQAEDEAEPSRNTEVEFPPIPTSQGYWWFGGGHEHLLWKI